MGLFFLITRHANRNSFAPYHVTSSMAFMAVSRFSKLSSKCNDFPRQIYFR